ncbi:MAG: hypothetical protein GF388_04605 [Candidatus Aegiribacteria sp.]|nr:hypothetical protein [Candidatus Aegiribacteria sp.]MBD3294515.1 hypothetical protein [Candidatus Fermentibacteria bacterium]
MNSARMLLLLVGIGFLWFIVRQMVKHWLSKPDRKTEYRKIDAEERAIEREAGDNIPKCPLCGAPTKLHSYPHITVWRCTEYPECRGFVKARKPRRPKFAAQWDRKRKRKRT